MNSFSEKNKNLDFTKNEKVYKNNIDYFNLKKDRAEENKQEKVSKFCICVSCSIISYSFCSYYLFINNL